MNSETDKTRETLIQLVSFRLGLEVYAIDISRVQEIKRMVEVTKVPQAPSYCEGVINLRGKVIPVIDLRTKLDLESTERDRNSRIVVYDVEGTVTGMIVDAVEEVLRIPRTTIEPTPAVATSTTSDYVQGIARVEERLLLILNISKIAAEVGEALVCPTDLPTLVVSESETR